MSMSGFGLTLAGDVLGALTGIKAVRVGGLSLAFDSITTIDAYRTGTATFTHDSDQVTGTLTVWTTDMAGRQIQLDADGTLCVIKSVESGTALTLTAAYTDTGAEDGAYTILPSRVAEHVPLGVEEQPIEIEFVYSKTVYDTISDAVLAQTSDTWTLTDVGGSTHVGAGRFGSCSDKIMNAAGAVGFTATLLPTTQWSFTPAA